MANMRKCNAPDCKASKVGEEDYCHHCLRDLRASYNEYLESTRSIGPYIENPQLTHVARPSKFIGMCNLVIKAHILRTTYLETEFYIYFISEVLTASHWLPLLNAILTRLMSGYNVDASRLDAGGEIFYTCTFRVTFEQRVSPLTIAREINELRGRYMAIVGLSIRGNLSVSDSYALCIYQCSERVAASPIVRCHAFIEVLEASEFVTTAIKVCHQPGVLRSMPRTQMSTLNHFVLETHNPTTYSMGDEVALLMKENVDVRGILGNLTSSQINTIAALHFATRGIQNSIILVVTVQLKGFDITIGFGQELSSPTSVNTLSECIHPKRDSDKLDSMLFGRHVNTMKANPPSFYPTESWGDVYWPSTMEGKPAWRLTGW